ncbi:bifunctional diguanylate cyclase/phosphodiesterase [Motiliproteus sp. MSK22-1]|uniref:sensor domain-containing protein n=1 Tax=Motiliproteus sp. MSK22-1 TaxID=1897630 RepID=UPI000975AD10|nr:bifunctional diguanylate cyclase/phosphodiesterase [Motiliproteus sp. MSK22-1]OMH30797.1 hypothetical protein BGP75_17375 [Motiliproteus sp. MSK22-1]
MKLQTTVPQSFLDQLPITVLAVDRKGVVRAANKSAGSLFGRHIEQLSSIHLTQLLTIEPFTLPSLNSISAADTAPDTSIEIQSAPDSLSNLLAQALFQSDKRTLFAISLDGNQHPVQIHLGQPSETSGETLITLLDISNQQEQENKTSVREQVYQSIFENELVGFYRTDITTGQLLECNERLAQMFGYPSREKMIADYLAPKHYVHSKDRDRLLAELARAGRVDDFESELYRLDGTVRWFRYTSTISVKNNSLEGLVTDITEEHQARKELLLTASAFNGTSEGILITNASRQILRVNQAFTDITGFTQSEVTGCSTRMLNSNRHDRTFFSAIWQQIETMDHWSGEIWIKNKEGFIFSTWHNISVVRDETGEILQYIVIFSDTTERKEAEERIAQLAHYDSLTELPNRLLFHDRCDHAMSKARRDHHSVAVLFLDLDGFKDINDSFGHPVGDRVLQAIARRIKDVIREEDTVARLGGDEFTVIIEELDNPQEAAVVADTLLNAIRTPVTIDNQLFHLSASIGISVFPDDGNNSTTLVSNADAAMYRAKDQGRNNFQFYTRELTTSAFERVWLENQLREAVALEQLSLVFQPQINLHQNIAVGVEALLRWQHPEAGMIPPDRFISVAEKCGLILPIGRWVVEESCKQFAHWLKQGVQIDRIAVNVSGAQLQREDFVTVVKNALGNSGIDPRRLELEVTESFIMTQADEGIRTLQALRELGVTLAIDDFGTGYSSLSYLKRLPIHRLKVDQSFVRDVPNDGNDEAIVKAIIALGHSLQLEIIAEGVESTEQQDFLAAEGCDEVQGFLYSKPLPAEQIPAYFNKREGLRNAAGQNLNLF